MPDKPPPGSGYPRMPDWLLYTGLGLLSAGLIGLAVATPFIVYH